jgi:hypothetical protein
MFHSHAGGACCLHTLADLGFHLVMMLEVFIFKPLPTIYNQMSILKHFLEDSLMKVYFFCQAEKNQTVLIYDF